MYNLNLEVVGYIGKGGISNGINGKEVTLITAGLILKQKIKAMNGVGPNNGVTPYCLVFTGHHRYGPA